MWAECLRSSGTAKGYRPHLRAPREPAHDIIGILTKHQTLQLGLPGASAQSRQRSKRFRRGLLAPAKHGEAFSAVALRDRCIAFITLRRGPTASVLLRAFSSKIPSITLHTTACHRPCLSLSVKRRASRVTKMTPVDTASSIPRPRARYPTRRNHARDRRHRYAIISLTRTRPSLPLQDHTL